jgi:diguanylate cyclase (GGDEF)-like protein
MWIEGRVGMQISGMVRQIGHALTAWLLHIGLAWAVLVIAVFSVLSSVLITGAGIHLTQPDISLEEWIYFAIITPAAISPVVGIVIMSLAYRLAQAQKVLARLAQTDPLTGIGNRRHFMESAASSLEQALRDGAEAALLMLDIDHFKQLNDLHGHAAGDNALIEVARCCSSHLSSTHTLGRWGGEEFCIFMPVTSTGEASEMADRLRTAIAATSIKDVPKGVSVSIGIAVTGSEVCDLDGLLRAADRHLYQAKAAGRDRISSGTPTREPRLVFRSGEQLAGPS